MFEWIKRKLDDDRGMTMVEYVAFAIIIIGVVTAVGKIIEKNTKEKAEKIGAPHVLVVEDHVEAGV